MPTIIDKVETIVLLMFENRSFDHMLGHLSLENINRNIDGYKRPLSQYNNHYQGDSYQIYNFPNDQRLEFDLPHEYDCVNIQLALSGISKRFTMTGFVEAYAKSTAVNPNPQAPPMGYFNSHQVPITSFLARTFCACDKWFCPLPTGTQPNRTMAFSGDSEIYKNGMSLPISENNIFDWLERAGVRWRVYHDGLSFFALYPSLWKYVLSGNFRDYEFLQWDLLNESPDKAPQVIIVEPSYADSPHVGSDRPNDNHPPLAIGWGEEFLRRTYEAITANQTKWKNTVMVTYYDEHGGFYDHVPPAPIKYSTSSNSPYQFNSTGPRIPAIIASPFVMQSSVCSSLFDHTSVLQLLAEKFTPGKAYSNTVESRRKQGVMSISAALTNKIVWAAPVPPNEPINVTATLGTSIKTPPVQINQKAFEAIALRLINEQPKGIQSKYPELLLWKQSVANAREA